MGISSLRKPSGPYRCILDSSLQNCNKLDEITESYDYLGVYFNVPYEEEFVKMEFAIFSTIVLHDLVPKLVRQERTSEVRLCKICRILQCCGYGITDFSFGRLNVAYELELLDALGKPVIISTDNRHKLDRDFSNLRGIDPISHEMDAKKLIDDLSDCVEAQWDDATRDVSRSTIFNMWETLVETYEDPTLDYSYKRINRFYQDLQGLFNGIAAEWTAPDNS